MKFESDHAPLITEIVSICEPASSDWFFPLHEHADRLEVSFVVSGSVDCYFDGLVKSLNAGDLLIKNAGIVHAEKMTGNEELREICISFDHVHISGFDVNQLIDDTILPVLQTENEPLFREMFIYLAQHRELPETLKQDMARTLISLICFYLPDMSEDLKEKKENVGQTIAQVKDYLDSHYARKISLDELGEMFFISPFYLTRQFKKYTGYTVKQYVLDRQMGEAERLLIFSELPIKEIALMCGYDNLQYFYTLFKKYARCTPIEYRSRFKK